MIIKTTIMTAFAVLPLVNGYARIPKDETSISENKHGREKGGMI
jgi:hypothetical protein